MLRLNKTNGIMVLQNFNIRRIKMALWKARTKDNKMVTEHDAKWIDVQDDISILSMITNDGKYIFLPRDMEKYVQFKTASADLNGKNVQIESRTIGFELGNNTIKIRVHEESGNISIEVE